MSNSSQFFPSTGSNFSDPRKLFRQYLDNASLWLATSTHSDVAGFWTLFADSGDFTAVTRTASTYSTLMSASGGPVILALIVGPVMAANTDTTTFRITVDGVVTVITMVGSASATSTTRAVLGNLSDPALFTTADKMVIRPGPSDNLSTSNIWYQTATGANVDLPSLQFQHLMGTPMLEAKDSLTVEVQLSATQSATALRETSAGVIYRTL